MLLLVFSLLGFCSARFRWGFAECAADFVYCTISMCSHDTSSPSFPAAAVGPGGGRWGGVGGSPKRLCKALTDNTKPQKTKQSPDRLYKAPTDYTKTQKYFTKPQNIRQRPTHVRQHLQYLTRVATSINLTYNIEKPILKTQIIN